MNRPTKHRFLFLAALSIVTCCSSPTTPTKQIARLNIQSEPRCMDPRIGGDRRSLVVIKMLFEGLTRMNSQGEPEMATAESVDISPDGKVYTFHLRDTYWSDGKPVRAKDFATAWKEMVGPEFPSPFPRPFFAIKNARAVKEGKLPADEAAIEALDDQTLQVTLEHPAPYFLELVSHGIFSPIPSHIATPDAKWCGSPQETFTSNGPFELASWRPDAEIVVKKSPTYWDTDHVALDEITLSIFESSEAGLYLFEQGELDWMGEPLAELPNDVLPALREKGELITTPVNGVFRYVLNTQRPPFQSEKMREAFSCAIDRPAIVNNLCEGGEQVSASFLPPTLTLQPAPLIEGVNVKKAQQLFCEGMKELGLTRETFPPIVLSYGNVSGQKALAQAIQQQWETTFGIPIRLHGSEWNVFFSDFLEKNFQVAGISWFSIFSDPIYLLEDFKFQGDAMNQPQWERPEYIDLINASDQELNPHLRERLHRQAEQMILKSLPVTPVHTINYRHIQSSQLEDVVITDSGFVDFKWARMKR